MELFKLLENMNFYQAEDGGSDGAPTPTPTPEATPTPTAFKSFSTEEEYNNALKSEKSKGKGEIMKELGISSVDEGKASLTKTGQLQEELNTYKTKATQLEESLTLNKLGVREDYSEEALSLAKSKVNDKVDLSTALGEVIKKFPMMTSKTQKNIGGDKGEGDPTEDQGDIKTELNKKYPWLNL